AELALEVDDELDRFGREDDVAERVGGELDVVVAAGHGGSSRRMVRSMRSRIQQKPGSFRDNLGTNAVWLETSAKVSDSRERWGTSTRSCSDGASARRVGEPG